MSVTSNCIVSATVLLVGATLVAYLYGRSAHRSINIEQAEGHLRNTSGNKKNEEKNQDARYVKCPFCRDQTVRSNAITGIYNSEKTCCCCLDKKCTVALTCGHLELCINCFHKL